MSNHGNMPMSHILSPISFKVAARSSILLILDFAFLVHAFLTCEKKSKIVEFFLNFLQIKIVQYLLK
jgi:hypothetical protein